MEELRTSGRTYLLLTFGWSTLFWVLSAPLGSDLVFLIGGAGPLVIALLLTHLREGGEWQRNFWIRTFDIRRIGVPWLAISLLLHPLLIVLAFVTDISLGGALPAVRVEDTGLLALLSLSFSVFIFGPLPEEMGWRGFAHDRIQKDYSPLITSLILGVVWSAWHIPLFLIPGTFQYGLGFGSARFWIFMASNIPLTFIMTWVYNNTNRSTLTAALIHFSGNMVGAIFAKTVFVALIEV
ncbi:MAG: CPBP family intramembrane glutamic endopeptidase, partial [Candidatus Kariarchaeaceae archaeon]